MLNLYVYDSKLNFTLGTKLMLSKECLKVTVTLEILILYLYGYKDKTALIQPINFCLQVFLQEVACLLSAGLLVRNKMRMCWYWFLFSLWSFFTDQLQKPSSP